MNCSEKNIFEKLWFDISSSAPNTQKSTIGIIYRHGDQATIPTFTSYMESRLNILNKENANFYIIGDFNIANDLDVDGHTNLDNISV